MMYAQKSLAGRAFWLIRSLPIALATGALFALMVITFADVMLRSVLNAPLEFATDLTRLLMAIVVFSAMPLLSFEGKQISVDLLDGLFRRLGILRGIEIVISLLCGALLFWPAKRVLDLAARSQSYGDRMEYLKLPLHYVEWFIAALTFATAVALLVRGVLLIFRPQMMEQTHD